MEDSNVSQETQSDSDSSESWTFVEKNIPKIENECHDVTSTSDLNSHPGGGDDNDTDGVAVISDDDESTRDTPQQEVDIPLDHQSSDTFIFDRPNNPHRRSQLFDFETASTTTFKDSDEELVDEFYASNKKIKSYVHKRNNKVSSLLNAVLLATLVTAATLAVGFMWGINDTCSIEMLDSVNNYLANLQKLQEENEILKSKIRILQAMRYNKPIKEDIDFEKFLEHHLTFESKINIPNAPREKEHHRETLKHKSYLIPIESNSDYLNEESVVGPNFASDLNEHVKDEINKSQNICQGDNQKVNQYTETTNKNKKQEKNKQNAKKENKNNKRKFKTDSKFNIEECNSADECPLTNESKSYNTAEKFTEKDRKYKDAKNKNMENDEKKIKQGFGNFDEHKRYKNQMSKQKQYEDSINEYWYDKMLEGRKQFRAKSFKDKLNDIKKDWYDKMSAGRKLIREKGFDDYDLLEMKNKAKWYFKRMNEREKSRVVQGFGKMASNGKNRQEY